MLDEFKALFTGGNGLQAVTEILKVAQQVVQFLDSQLQEPEKVNAAIEHVKAVLDMHKKA